MAKFIHLSLLLAATAQLPVVSVTKIFLKERDKVTFKFPSNWTIEYCCRGNWCKFVDDGFQSWGVKVTNSDLTIHIYYHNIRRDGNYCFYGDSIPPIHTDLLLCLQITGCTNPWTTNCRVKFPDCPPPTEENCKINCDGNQLSKLVNNECQLRTSCNNVEIQLNDHCLINSSSENDGQIAADLLFYREAKSWIDALEHCQNQMSSLVQITDQIMQQKVNSSLLKKKESMQKGAWIGLERSIFGKSDVPWKWISESEVKEHPPWNASFPVDALNHHCGKIIWVEELRQFKWLDACCHEKLPFICQTAPI